MNIYKDDHYTTMATLSDKGFSMEKELKDLADKYGYKKLPKELSQKQREHYMEELDSFWRCGDFKHFSFNLTSSNGTTIATGVTPRGFVCGDYGVFLEIETNQIKKRKH